MALLYHFVPENMEGNVLYPLNMLQLVAPQIAKNQKQKYQGRDAVLRQRVEPLDCSWGDVLFLSATPPQAVKDALQAAGFGDQPLFQVYEVPVAILQHKNLVALVYDSLESGHVRKHYEKFESSKLNLWSKIPQATLNYYEQCKNENEEPFTFWGITHLLYKGSLDVSQLKILSI